MKQETADAIDVFDRVIKIVNHWTDNKLGDEVLHIAMEVQILLNSLVSEDEFDPVYYWEHLSEEDKHKVCDMQNNEIARREYKDWLHWRLQVGNDPTVGFLDYLDQQEVDE